MSGSRQRQPDTTVAGGIGVLEAWFEAPRSDPAGIGRWLCRAATDVGSAPTDSARFDAGCVRELLTDVRAASGVPEVPEELLHDDSRAVADRVTRCVVTDEWGWSAMPDGRRRVTHVLEALATNAARAQDVAVLAALTRTALVAGAGDRPTVRRGVGVIVAAVAPDGGVLHAADGDSGGDPAGGLSTAVQCAWALVERQRPGFTYDAWRAVGTSPT